MLLDIFVTVPFLLMTNIAWSIGVGLVLICLIVLFAVVIGAVSFLYADDHSPSHRPGPKLVPQP